ncbi:glutathione S-transferase family protein [Pelomonas aquatica]|jgi:glutathione S-transferase|uniref:Glutathione S-transferase family protein n=1 Tax=Pelomonas aquatica TaxID=431058 RepID=A0A9X4LJP6_9BURK|nr:glutathione S-transferase family protein [Pelomonas aquatica]MCY4756088.1 glutathione S-transferase family protein [Pelomonas aquatica]MDG0864049.1 glutathione S-transferase family protein [Pelomonas aquatica]
MKLLGRLTSINVRKVMWTAAQLGLELDREDWGAGFRSPQEAGYLALNPNGLIPVLIDGGFTLWESNSICRYLAAKAGATALLPAEPQARAKVEQWMDWQAGELNNAWRVAFMALVRGQPHAPEAVAASVASWNRHMAMLDAQLARTGAHVCGDAFTLADIVLGLSAQRWKNAPIARAELPAVDAWLQRLSSQPGFAEFVDNGMP